MTKNERMRQQYIERKAAGICVRCGKKAVVSKKLHCKECLVKVERAYAAKQQKVKTWAECEMTCPDFCPFDECKMPGHVAAKTIGIIDHGERIREPGRAVIFGTIPRNVHF